MKKIILILFVSILMVGCADKEVKEKTIQDVKTVKELGKYLNIKEKNKKDYKMIGALDGYGFYYEGNEFEAYEYLNKYGIDRAKQMFKHLKYETIGSNIFVISYSKKVLTDLAK